MTENEIARQVVDAAFKVHSTLGPGLLESVYERVLAYELSKRGVSLVHQVPIDIEYDGQTFSEGFRADLVRFHFRCSGIRNVGSNFGTRIR
jgi:GxxExxY protein